MTRRSITASDDYSGGAKGTPEGVTFASPTAAVQFVYGGAINGRITWKETGGKSIKDV